MSKPMIHARSSARRFGGVPEDYIEIHDFMDSSKAAFPDNRHRALTHNSWFIFIVERVFGHEINLTCKFCVGKEDARSRHQQEHHAMCEKCGDEKKRGRASVRDVAEQHVLEDFGGKYIPTVADYLEGMEFQPWMNNGVKGSPSSHRKIVEAQNRPAEDPLDVDTLGELLLDSANPLRRNFTLD